MIRRRNDLPRTLNVVVVEDDPDDARLLERALLRVAQTGGRSIGITHHRNGWDALRAVGHSDVLDELPDFVVVDLNMPVMDGMRFLRLLRGELRLPDLRAYVLTTSDRPEIHEAAREMGADRVFRKPDGHRELVAIVEAMMRDAVHEVERVVTVCASSCAPPT